ncbi:hypothetical protein N0V88_006581 [Collariella sp. IMI 366227]|nr:hypothetical protein N0V88_006581 [Collariella sp. IMI 366227]
MADSEHVHSIANHVLSTSKPESTTTTKETARPSSKLSNSHDEANGPVPHLHAKTFLAVFAVCLIYFAQLVSLVGAGVQGQTIGAHFNDTTKVVWFAGSIGMLTGILGPIVSQAADYWGRKWFLVLLTLLGAVGCCVISRANTSTTAVAGFCLTGLAFGTQPLLHVVTAEILPRRWRGWAHAFPSISATLGSLLGLFAGAALNRTSNPASDGFRYYYYMAMVCFLLASLICLVAYNPPPLPAQTQFTISQKLAKLDWTGYFLFASGCVLFSVGLSYSKNPYPWSNPLVSATFAIGMALTLALGAYERFARTDGLFHHGLFSRNSNFSIAMFCITLEGLAFFAVNSYFSFQLSTPPELLSVASGLFISARSLGGVVGLAIYNAVFNGEMSKLEENVGSVVVEQGLARENLEAFVAALLKHNETAFENIPGATPEIIDNGVDAMIGTYTVAFRNVWITAGCFVAAAAIAAMFLVDEQDQFNMRIDNPIEKEEELYSA